MPTSCQVFVYVTAIMQARIASPRHPAVIRFETRTLWFVEKDGFMQKLVVIVSKSIWYKIFYWNNIYKNEVKQMANTWRTK